MLENFPLQTPYMTLRFHTSDEGSTEKLTSQVESFVTHSDNLPFDEKVYLQVGMPLDMTESPLSSPDWQVGMTGEEREVYYLNGFLSGVPFSMNEQTALPVENSVIQALYNYQFTTQIRIFIMPDISDTESDFHEVCRWLQMLVSTVTDQYRLAGLSGGGGCPPPTDGLSSMIKSAPPPRRFTASPLQDTPLWYEKPGDGMPIAQHLHQSYQRGIDMMTKVDDVWEMTSVATHSEKGHSLSLNMVYLIEKEIVPGHLTLSSEQEVLPVWYMDIDSQTHHVTLSQIIGVPLIKSMGDWQRAIMHYHPVGFFNAEREMIWVDFMAVSALDYAHQWVDHQLDIMREPGGCEEEQYSVYLLGEAIYHGTYPQIVSFLEVLVAMPPASEPLMEATDLAIHFSSMALSPLASH